jgi:predicted GNAT family N-acyltransferase
MIELLDKKHVKENFDCGNEILNGYIKRQAGQDIKRKLAVCFVISDKESNEILGYYTLSNNSIPLNSLPTIFQKKLPQNYTHIPTTLIGRLAIHNDHKGKGMGKILLIDALKRSYEISQKIGSFAVVVDPIDEKAESFYEKYDFIKLPDSNKMFITTKTLKELFA